MTVERVEIIVPARNEEKFIGGAVRSLIPTRQWPFSWHLTVVDGGSTDSTPNVVRTLDPYHVAVAFNPAHLQSAGVNMVALSLPVSIDVVVRADAHCSYPPDFAAKLVATMELSGADSVVVPMVSECAGGSWFGRATAAAQNSRLGNGGSAHRNGGSSGFVDHGHHAAFRREVFAELGGYDESFSHNEDSEFDIRMKTAGRKVYLAGEIPVVYFVREIPRDLARQYFNHGAGRARTVLKHKTIRLRQLAPAAVTAVNAGSICLSVFWPALLSVPALYAICCLVLGAFAPQARGPERLAGIPAMIMHHAWGMGFLSSIARTMIVRAPFQWISAFA